MFVCCKLYAYAKHKTCIFTRNALFAWHKLPLSTSTAHNRITKTTNVKIKKSKTTKRKAEKNGKPVSGKFI